jgi:hypothetical protein
MEFLFPHSIGVPILVFILIIGYLLSNASKKLTQKPNKAAIKAANELNTMRAIVDRYSDYTAEVTCAFIGASSSHLTKYLPRGSKIELRMDGLTSLIYVYVDGQQTLGVANYDESKGSNIPRLIKEHHRIDTYISGRNTDLNMGGAELLQIISFYKVDGIPPTKVEIGS